MPGISRVRPIAAPATELNLPERIDHLSPDGEWNLVFERPLEWRMGVEGSQVKLLHRGRDVTAKHREFFGLAGYRGFQWARHFQPWSRDSKSLAMATWDQTPVHLYEVATSTDKPLSHEGPLVNSLQWAPDMDRLLMTFRSSAILVDHVGEQHGVVHWRISDYETPHTYWMKSGQIFFVLARQSGAAKTEISFYSGVDGTSQESYELDAIDLVPYQKKDYAEIARDSFSLVVRDPPVRAVGALLDDWNNVVFDQATGTLILSVYRPVSVPYREGDELLCQVQQSSVAVELN